MVQASEEDVSGMLPWAGVSGKVDAGFTGEIISLSCFGIIPEELVKETICDLDKRLNKQILKKQYALPNVFEMLCLGNNNRFVL